MKCTQKNPNCRYPNMTALIADLKRSLVDPDGNFVVIPKFDTLGDTMMASSIDIERARREAANYDTGSYSSDTGYYDTGSYEDDYDRQDDDYDEEEYDQGYDDDDTYSYGKKNRSGKGRRKDNEDVNPGMTKVLKILTGVVAVIIVFVLVFIGARAMGLLKFDSGKTTVKEEEDMAKMPNVIGKKQEDAIKMLNKEGLGYQTPVKTEESEKYEKGYVIKTDIKAGEKVKKNTRIVLTVSSGLKKEKAIVPEVSGYTTEEAIEMLVGVGFAESNITPKLVFDSNVENGKVIKTDPAGNEEVAKDSKITLYVSKGKDQVPVPGLTGKDQETAAKLLSDAGLGVGQITQEYSSEPAGTVIDQSISEGTKVDKGTTVNITVSQGEKPKPKPTVPNIVGNSVGNARNALLNMGLKYKEVWQDSNEEAGIVISCDPGAGQEVEEGSTITIYISNGPKTPEIPDPDPTDPNQGNGNGETE